MLSFFFQFSADPVPNIRLRLCSILPQLKGLIKLPKDSQLLQELESCIKTLISNEKDRDVSYAVSRVRNIKHYLIFIEFLIFYYYVFIVMRKQIVIYILSSRNWHILNVAKCPVF